MYAVGFLISFFILTIGLYVIWRPFKKVISLQYLWLGWAIKLLFAFSFFFIFTAYYSNGTLYGDAGRFLKDSEHIYDYALTDGWGYIKLLFGFQDEQLILTDANLAQTNIWSYGDNGDFINDNRLILRVNSLIHFISQGNALVHILFMSFLAYNGILLTFSVLRKHLKNPKLIFIVLVGFPNLAFWTSGLTKEALMLFGLGLFLKGLFELLKKWQLTALFFLLSGVFILLFNKPYVGIMILPLSLVLFAGKLSKWSINLRKSIPVVVVIFTIGACYVPSPYNWVNKISYKQKDLINIGKGGIFFINDSAFCAVNYHYRNHFERYSKDSVKINQMVPASYKLFGDTAFYPTILPAKTTPYALYLIQPPSASYIETVPINNEPKKLATAIPAALNNTLIRPYPWDPGNALKIFSFFNNLGLLVLFFYALYSHKKLSPKEKYMLLYFIMAAIGLFLLIGWTIPILGAIVRYKVAGELFLIIAGGLLLKKQSSNVQI